MIAFVLFIFFMPLARLVLLSLKTDNGLSLSNYTSLLADIKTWQVIKNSIYISSMSTILSLIIGVFMAWIIAYTDIGSKTYLQFMIMLPFVIPSYIISLSWTQFMSQNSYLGSLLKLLPLDVQPLNMYSYTGIILTMGLTHFPIVYLLTVNVFRKIPRDLEWSARTCGNHPITTFYKINLPLAMPGIVGGGLLAFIASMDNFGIPAFLGIPAGIKVLSTNIYEEIVGFGPLAFSRGAALSVILAIIVLLGASIQILLLKKSRGLEAIKEDYSVRHSLGKYKRPAEILIWTFLISISIVPIISMFGTSLIKAYGLKFSPENITLKNYAFILFESTKTRRAIFNSGMLALTATGICIMVGTWLAYLKSRKPSKFMSMVENIISLPYAIPGTVLALSMIFHWIQPIPGWKPGIYGTIKILIISYVTRYLILQVKGSYSAIVQIDRSVEEAASVCGAGLFQKWKQVLIPLILPGVLSGSFLVLISSLTELTLSSLLWSSGAETIGVTIFNFEQAGFVNYSTAFSSIVILLILVGAILLKILPNIRYLRILKKQGEIKEAKVPLLGMKKKKEQYTWVLK